jgi:hypothetical protein
MTCPDGESSLADERLRLRPGLTSSSPIDAESSARR